MPKLLQDFNAMQLKNDLPDIRPGDTVRIHQKIKGEKEQEKIQIFEGLVLARKHGKGLPSTITIRKVLGGIGIEKIFPVHSPIIQKIEVVKRGKVKRAKLYYLRTAKGRKARLKRKEFSDVIPQEEPKKEITENIENSQAISETQAPGNIQETKNHSAQEESQENQVTL